MKAQMMEMMALMMILTRYRLEYIKERLWKGKKVLQRDQSQITELS